MRGFGFVVLEGGTKLLDWGTRSIREDKTETTLTKIQELIELYRPDLVVAEATLKSAEFDDPRRGHLTPEEALDMGIRADAGEIVLVHFRAELRDRVEAACAGRPGAIGGRPGLRIDVVPGHRWVDDPHPAPVRLVEAQLN